MNTEHTDLTGSENFEAITNALLAKNYAIERVNKDYGLPLVLTYQKIPASFIVRQDVVNIVLKRKNEKNKTTEEIINIRIGGSARKDDFAGLTAKAEAAFIKRVNGKKFKSCN